MTLQTASTHLSKLDEGGLLRPRKQGRHKYFSLANDDVARVLEGLMGLAAGVRPFAKPDRAKGSCASQGARLL